jgi:hypothetical protein
MTYVMEQEFDGIESRCDKVLGCIPGTFPLHMTMILQSFYIHGMEVAKLDFIVILPINAKNDLRQLTQVIFRIISS